MPKRKFYENFYQNGFNYSRHIIVYHVYSKYYTVKISVPENIDLTHPERYTFAVYICPDRLFFSLFNPADEQVYFYREIKNAKQTDTFSNFKDVFFENEFFALPYRKVYLLNQSSVFTYVPSIVYDEKHKEDYMKFLFTGHMEKILSHALPEAGITVLHQLPEETYNFFLRTYVNPEFIHHSAPLIAYFREKNNRFSGKQMIVNKNGKGMDILCFSKKTLLLGNHFLCEQMSDAVYYIIFIFKQLNFSQLNDYIYLIGDSISKNELQENLASYVQNIISENIAPESHFASIDAENIPFELAALTLYEL
jgi:hypothetical protein